MKTVYDDHIMIEYEKDGWICRVALPKPVSVKVDYGTVYVTYQTSDVSFEEFDPSEDPIGRG